MTRHPLSRAHIAVEEEGRIVYMTDMSRARTNTEGGLATMGLQVSMPNPATTRQRRRETLGLSAEEQRMANNAKRIRVDAADGTLEDLTGLRGKELMSRLLRK